MYFEHEFLFYEVVLSFVPALIGAHGWQLDGKNTEQLAVPTSTHKPVYLQFSIQLSLFSQTAYDHLIINDLASVK